MDEGCASLAESGTSINRQDDCEAVLFRTSGVSHTISHQNLSGDLGICGRHASTPPCPILGVMISKILADAQDPTSVILVKYRAIDPDALWEEMNQGTYSSGLEKTNTDVHSCREMDGGDQPTTESTQRDPKDKDGKKESVHRDDEDVIGKDTGEVDECEEAEKKSLDPMDEARTRDFSKNKSDPHRAKYFVESVNNAFKDEETYVSDNKLFCNEASKKRGEKEDFEEIPHSLEQDNVNKYDEEDINASEDVEDEDIENLDIYNEDQKSIVLQYGKMDKTSPETNEGVVENKEGKRKLEERNDNNCARPDTVAKRTIRKAVRRSIHPSACHSLEAPATPKPQPPPEGPPALTEERNRSLSVDDEKPLDMKEKLRSVQFGVFDESEERGGASEWNYKGPDDLKFEKNVASFETFKEAYNANIDFKCRVSKESDKHFKKFEKPLDKQNGEQIKNVQDKKNHRKKSLWQRFLRTFLKH